MSMNPGSTVASERSTTSSPLPAAVKPASTERILPASTTTVTRSRGALPVPSISRPAWIRVAAEAAPTGSNAASAANRIAVRIRTSLLESRAGLVRHGLDREQLDVEDQRRVRRDDAVARAAAAIGERRRDDETALAADLHARDALFPAPDHAPAAKRKRKRLAAVARAVELAPVVVRRGRVVEPARVV